MRGEGTTVTGDDPTEGDSFDERARTLNSNLRRLIDTVGVVLTASGELLARLQGLLGGAPPKPALPDPTCDDGAPPAPDRPEE